MVKHKDMQFFIENLKMNRKRTKNILTFRSGDLNPRFSVIFPPMIWIFKWGARDQIKKASKKDRNLPLTIFSVCLEESGFESQISLLNPPENFSGKLKVPGRESKEVVITEVWGGANQGFGSCFSSRKKKVQFEFKVLAMVFCYQNCSDLLWEKIVLLIKKNFWKLFWDH